MNLKEKIVTGVMSLAITASLTMNWNKATYNKSLYGNKPQNWITTEAGQKKNVAWITNRHGFNGYACYGMSNYIASSPTLVTNYNLKLKRGGVISNGFIYSSTSAISQVDFFNKRQTNDSAKFNFMRSEIEQYRDGDRPGFYRKIRAVGLYCDDNGMWSECYQGWPNETDMDSIITYNDRLWLHAYLQLHNSSNVGASIYGYLKGRFNMVVKAMDKKYPNDRYKKASVGNIYSTENPDPDETQFSYKYFLTHTFEDAQSAFIGYWNTHATLDMKRRIQLAGSLLFVEDQAKLTKP